MPFHAAVLNLLRTVVIILLMKKMKLRFVEEYLSREDSGYIISHTPYYDLSAASGAGLLSTPRQWYELKVSVRWSVSSYAGQMRILPSSILHNDL